MILSSFHMAQSVSKIRPCLKDLYIRIFAEVFIFLVWHVVFPIHFNKFNTLRPYTKLFSLTKMHALLIHFLWFPDTSTLYSLI